MHSIHTSEFCLQKTITKKEFFKIDNITRNCRIRSLLAKEENYLTYYTLFELITSQGIVLLETACPSTATTDTTTKETTFKCSITLDMTIPTLATKKIIPLVDQAGQISVLQRLGGILKNC